MNIEIRAAQGGKDAELFASDLQYALHSALAREGVIFTADGPVTSVRSKTPIWL